MTPQLRLAFCLAAALAVSACGMDAGGDDGSAATHFSPGTAASGDGGPASGGLDLVLPTSNRGLLNGHPERFYQGLNVTIDSLRPEKWEGGQYGFVRDPVPTVFGRRTFRRVHEGLDIAPVGRDADGEPVDTVVAISPGRVAYVNTSANASSYGKYVVVEHRWSGSPVYSLYAHLADVFATPGQPLRRGQPLGKMGYTGRGLGRSRAHVHLEIALMVNRNEPLWYAEYFGGATAHGLFFGTNLAGVDPAGLYQALADDPGLTFPEYVRSQDEGYVVDLPGGQRLDLVERYPWLGQEAAAADPATVPAWRVAFTQEGAPIRVEVGSERVERPTVEGVSLGIWLTDGSTNRMLQRRGLSYEPARRGTSYFALYATTPDGAPRW